MQKAYNSILIVYKFIKICKVELLFVRHLDFPPNNLVCAFLCVYYR